MNHSRAQDLLSPYLENDLSDVDRSAVESHLAACDGCSEDLRDLREAVALLRRLPAPEPPPFLASRVMARIADGEGQARGWRQWLAQASLPLIAAPLAAAAAALAVFALASPSAEDVGPSQIATASTPTGTLVPRLTGPVGPAPDAAPRPEIFVETAPVVATRTGLPGLMARRLRGAGHPYSVELAGHFEVPNDAVAVSWRTR